MYGCLGVRVVQGVCGNSKGDMEGTPAWDNTYKLNLHMPFLCCMVNIWGVLAHVRVLKL